MSQRERGIFSRVREADQEKELRSRFQEYEEWRASQADEAEEPAPVAKDQPKKKGGFTKLDILFVGLGVIAAMLWRSCNQ